MIKLYFKIFLMIFINTFLFANNLTEIDLSKSKWEYRWGDSPFENNIPLWTIKDTDSSNWHEIEYPRNPPNRNNQTNLWLRVKLPDTLTKDPTLYIFSIDFITQVYSQNKQIYHFGEFDKEGKGSFAGWPWHKISLLDDSAGQYLYFRIFSDYTDIGFFGEILISSKGYIFQKMLDYDIPKIVVGSISIFVAILFLLASPKFRRIELFILGLLFLTQGLNVFFSAKIIEMYLYFPLIKQYILAIAFFFFPVGMAMFMDKVIKNEVPLNIIKRLWQIHLIYLFGAIFGSILGFYNISSTYKYFDIFYNFISLPILTIFMIYFFFKGDKQTKIVTFSLFIISIYWVYSSLIAYGLVPWEEYPSDIAVFLCLLLLSFSIVDRLNYTKELEEAKKELTVLSSTDYLTKLNNRKELDCVLKTNENLFKRYKDNFSIILLDIDDFKEVNDTYGHLVGDQLLIKIAEILKKFTRQTDVVGRWGGEEFLIICPKTNVHDAMKLAENLRIRISKEKFDLISYKTASFGVSSYLENDSIADLLARADEAMYLAKAEGKNKVQVIIES